MKVSSTNDLDTEPMCIKEVWTVNSDSFSNVQQNIHTDWKHVKNLNIPDVKATEVRLLIGINAPKEYIQTDFREGRENQPIAVCTRLGWSILGTTSRSESDEIQAKVHFIVQRDQQLHQQIEQFWKTESFGVIYNDNKATSVEDSICGLKSTSLTLFHPLFIAPSFLQTNEDSWPRNIDVRESQVKQELCKPKDVMHVQCSTNSVHDKPFKDISKCIDFNRYSSFQRLTRVTAWFLRAVNNFCSAIKRFKFTRVINEGLSSDEWKDAKYLLVQQAQEEKYGFEIDQIKAGKPVNQKNSLLPLTPIYDGRFLRVGGRLRKASIPEENKHQISLLEKHSNYKIADS